MSVSRKRIVQSLSGLGGGGSVGAGVGPPEEPVERLVELIVGSIWAENNSSGHVVDELVSSQSADEGEAPGKPCPGGREEDKPRWAI